MLNAVPSCGYCAGKEVKYVQKKAPLKPNWQACFDAHLYPGRTFEMIVMQRPDKKVSEVRVTVQSLADRCRSTDDIASVWVRTGWAKKVIPLVQCNICTRGIAFLAHPV